MNSMLLQLFYMYFIITVLLVYFSESINEIASTNWHVFSRQQYFDSKGLFISVVFSMPILLNCMLMVVRIKRFFKLQTKQIIKRFLFLCNLYCFLQGSWLYQSTQLMKTLKTAQLREKIKKEKESQKVIKAKPE